MNKFYSKYFDPVDKPYLVAICKGTFKGRVGEVVGLSNQFFSISKAGLALVQIEGFNYKVPVPIEVLQGV